MNTQNTYDQQATQYAKMVAQRNAQNTADLPLESVFFNTIGNVQGLTILDAGCGEGFVSRTLAKQGANVTGIDISAPLINTAKTQNTHNITYEIHDLSQPLPKFKSHFDLIACHMALNDVPNHLGFITTLASVLKPSGRAVFSLNNPYSAPSRNKADGYFDSGNAVIYSGMAQMGVEVYYYHRTMEEYLTAFCNNGFLLRQLKDIQHPDPAHHWNNIPFLMVIELIKNCD